MGRNEARKDGEGTRSTAIVSLERLENVGVSNVWMVYSHLQRCSSFICPAPAKAVSDPCTLKLPLSAKKIDPGALPPSRKLHT